MDAETFKAFKKLESEWLASQRLKGPTMRTLRVPGDWIAEVNAKNTEGKILMRGWMTLGTDYDTLTDDEFVEKVIENQDTLKQTWLESIERKGKAFSFNDSYDPVKSGRGQVPLSEITKGYCS